MGVFPIMQRIPRIGVATILPLLWAGAGCMPQVSEAPLTKQQAYDVLNAIILDPFTTCEQLRTAFRVEHLPVVSTPDEAGLRYEEAYVPAFDATPLRVWRLPTSLDRGTVVLSVGASGSMPCYLYTARLLVDNGWSVVVYDYRGFGGSGGTANIAYLAADLDAIIDWTLARTGRDEVTLMGISLGTIPSVAMAVQRPDVVNGVILDSPVALGMEIQRFGFVLGDPTTYQKLIDPLLLSDNLMAAVQTPLLVLLNERDRLTPPSQTELLFDRAAGPKELARFPDVGHARGVFRDTEYYAYRVESFLARLWGQYEPLPFVRGE